MRINKYGWTAPKPALKVGDEVTWKTFTSRFGPPTACYGTVARITPKGTLFVQEIGHGDPIKVVSGVGVSRITAAQRAMQAWIKARPRGIKHVSLSMEWGDPTTVQRVELRLSKPSARELTEAMTELDAVKAWIAARPK